MQICKEKMEFKLISGFVVAYNREHLLTTCLRSIRFVDELIVIDKSSTDNTNCIARQIADRVITVPWSPTVEETRKQAALECRGEFILFLDDDECFSPQAIQYFHHEGTQPSSDIYLIPCRDLILGRHDERAYYWPSSKICAFQKGAVNFHNTVHAGVSYNSDNIKNLSSKEGICSYNISHESSHQWIEKTNRYTSVGDRKKIELSEGSSIAQLAIERVEFYASKISIKGEAYLEAVAMLRAVYDIIDIVKTWEQKTGLDGRKEFNSFCEDMQIQYDELEKSFGIRTFNRKNSF